METPGVSKDVKPLLPPTRLPLDRRKRERYRVKEGVLLSPVTKDRKYWKMLDVSMGGASFRYIPPLDLNGFSKIDIATQDLDFSVNGIPFSVISDCELPDSSASSFELRRCGVEFGVLTDHQESRLAELIRQYTLCIRVHPRRIDEPPFHSMSFVP
jgi:hypothetical protein